MSATTNVQVVISAKDNASGVIKGVGKSFGGLGQKVTSSLKTIGLLGIVAGTALTVFGVKAAFSAARIEELELALGAMARANKISQKEVDSTVRKLRDFNIAHDKALEVTSLFIQSELDLADAVKLANVAKDLGILASLDSSEATKTLTQAIVTQRPILLKQFGIQTGLVKIYDTYAKKIGKTAEELTEAEKKQAFLNIILVKGKKVAGTYEAAMGSVSKRFRSLTGRIIPDFMAKIGKAFQPALTVIIDSIADSIADLSDWIDANQEKIKEWGKISGEVAQKIVAGFGKFVSFLIRNKEIVIGVLLGFAAGIASVGVAFVAAHWVIFGVMAGITVVVVAAIKAWNSNFLNFRFIIEQNIKAFKFWRDVIKNSVAKITDSYKKIKDKLLELKEGIEDILDDIKTKWDEFTSKFRKIVDSITRKIDDLSKAFSTFVEDFKNDAEDTLAKAAESIAILMLERINTIVLGWSEGLESMLDTLFDWTIRTNAAIDQWLTDTVIAIDQWITNTVMAINDWATKTLESMNIGLDSMLVSLDNFFTNLPDKITTWLDNVWENMKTWWFSLGEKSLEEILKGFEKERSNWILKITGFILAALAIVLALLVAELIDLGIRIVRFIFLGIKSMQKSFNDKFFAFLKGGFSLAGKVGTAIFNFGKDIIDKLIDGIKAAPRAVAEAILSLIPNAALRSAIKKAIPGLQYGTNFFPGGPAIVGERGPELVNLPRGAQVIPNERLPMGSTFHITLNVGTLIDSDNTRRNFAERLINDIENIAAMKGKRLSIIK